MKVIGIDHANVFFNHKDVLVEIELTDEDKEKIWGYHLSFYDDPYDMQDVSMLVWVTVNGKTATGINYVAYYPEDQGETEYPIKFMDEDIVIDCLRFVNKNYFGNEDKYDDK